MAKVAIVMGSKSDWPTMQKAALMLRDLGVEYDASVVSAHRTPQLLTEFAETAADKGIEVIIAGAGGAAHLPGMIAAHTHLPVLGVPVRSSQLSGLDSLLTNYKPEFIHDEISGPYKEFKAGRRYPWAADRVM